MPLSHPRLAVLTLAIVAAATVPRSARADPQGTSTDVPVQVEDAYVVRLGDLELQDVSLFTKDTHGSAGHDLFNLVPEIKYGVTKHLELVVGTDYATGNQSGANTGAGSLTALYQINQNTTYIPAFALEAGYATPYGAGHKTAEYTFKAIATKNLGPSDSAPRIDLNLLWTHRTQAEGSTRVDQLGFGIAYSMLINKSTAVVVDYVHGALATRGRIEDIIDVGFRHELTSSLAVSVGGGVGLTGESPNYRFIVALQQSFQLFGSK